VHHAEFRWGKELIHAETIEIRFGGPSSHGFMSPLGHVTMPCRTVDETTAPVLDPGRGKTKTGYFRAVMRDDRGWNGPSPPGVVFHYRPGRKGEYAEEILKGFDGTIQVESKPTAWWQGI